MSESDKTKEVLEQILAELYFEQAKDTKSREKSYLIAEDGQLLGNITKNNHDINSILNKYGPYGSPYSTTSIFNKYSKYGSQYGPYSINNPFCNQPPNLIINGKSIGKVTSNKSIKGNIAPEAFIFSLENSIDSLLSGKIIESETTARAMKRESFIEAQDGTFLGKLNPNKYDQESIFNRFGSYGNQFSQVSIFNRYSPYGSQFSDLSPFNKFSNTPPKIYVDGNFVAYLSVNTFIKPRIDPEEILDWAERNISKYN